MTCPFCIEHDAVEWDAVGKRWWCACCGRFFGVSGDNKEIEGQRLTQARELETLRNVIGSS